uniref:Uncharacterized protein LOC114345211 n=1 Tax=Diabrotica virgifera virgifera TaxID=50390 RepID=A0A6P7H7B9_DIAVI
MEINHEYNSLCNVQCKMEIEADESNCEYIPDLVKNEFEEDKPDLICLQTNIDISIDSNILLRESHSDLIEVIKSEDDISLPCSKNVEYKQIGIGEKSNVAEQILNSEHDPNKYFQRYASVAKENEDHTVLLEEDNVAIGKELSLENSNGTTHSSIEITMQKSSNPKRRGHQAVESASAVLMKHLLEEEINEEEKDDIDLFFDAIKATVKKLNAGNKLLAKQRVFGVISELEEFNMNQCNQFVHSSSIANVLQQFKPT